MRGRAVRLPRPDSGEPRTGQSPPGTAPAIVVPRSVRGQAALRLAAETWPHAPLACGDPRRSAVDRRTLRLLAVSPVQDRRPVALTRLQPPPRRHVVARRRTRRVGMPLRRTRPPGARRARPRGTRIPGGLRPRRPLPTLTRLRRRDRGAYGGQLQLQVQLQHPQARQIRRKLAHTFEYRVASPSRWWTEDEERGRSAPAVSRHRRACASAGARVP